MFSNKSSSNTYHAKSPKEILSILLKQHLDDSLIKLEQKIHNDKNILCSIKETSNKMNKFLEDSFKKGKYYSYKSQKNYIVNKSSIKSNKINSAKTNLYENKHETKKKQIEKNDEVFNGNKYLTRNNSFYPISKQINEEIINKKHKVPKLVNRIHKLEKENTKISNNINKNTKKIITSRNSILSNTFLTEKNKLNISTNKTPNILTNKKKTKFKKIFRKSCILTAKLDKTRAFIGENALTNLKGLNIRGSYNKKLNVKNYRKVITKMKLFHENRNDSNTLDIKSYETNFITPSISENQEQKLYVLSSSLLNLTQKDELLINNNCEEKLESNIDFIIGYLSIKDLLNLALVKKEFYKIIIKNFADKTELKIEKIKEKINDIIIKGKGYIKLKNKYFDKIEKSIFDERAMNLIDSISKKKLFKEKSSLMNNQDIILLFEIFFISIGKKYDIVQFDANNSDIYKKRWNYFCNYFNNNESKYIKNIIEKDLINRKISNEIINSLYEWSNKYIDKIKPNHFQIINKDIAIFSYIIKGLLDYFGISNENKVNLQKLYILHNVRLEVNEKIFSKLNQMLNSYIYQKNKIFKTQF